MISLFFFCYNTIISLFFLLQYHDIFMLIGRYINNFFLASWANILTDYHTPTEFEPCGISWWIYNNNQEGPPYGTIVQSGWETVVIIKVLI